MEAYRLYFTLAILWIGHFLVDFMIGVWPLYKTMAELDLAKAGIMAGVCAFAGEGMQIIFGPLSDRGYRKTLILFGILMASGATLFAYTTNYYLLFLFLLMTCIGSGAFHPSAVGLIGSLPINRKSLLVTIFACGGSLGMASSQFIFANAFDTFAGHTLFMAIPAICLVSLAFSYKFVGMSHANPSQPRKGLDLHLFANCFRNRNISLLFVSQVCNQTVMWGTCFLLPDVLHTRGYDSWITYGGGFFCFIMGGALMLIPSGYLADKYSSKKVIIGSTILGGIFFYLFLFGQELSSPVVLTLLFFMGAFITVVHPVSVAFGNRLMPKNPGVVSALLMGLVWCVAESLGPGGGGLLTKAFEEDAPAKVLYCMGLLLVVNVFVALKLPSNIPVENLEGKTPEYAITPLISSGFDNNSPTDEQR